MRRTHKPHRQRRLSVTVIAVSQRKYVDRLIQALVSRVFLGIPLFPVMSRWCFVSRDALSYTLLHLFSVWLPQEALASFDLCASHSLPHDPMPVRDEEKGMTVTLVLVSPAFQSVYQVVIVYKTINQLHVLV